MATTISYQPPLALENRLSGGTGPSALMPSACAASIAGSMEQGLAIAKRYSDQYDIIISRANTANMISQAVHIPVIDIGIGYYDVLRCIKLAQNAGTKFALLGFQSLTVIAKNLCDLLQIKLDIFSFSPENWTDSNRHLILDLDGNCLYSTLDGEKEDLFISSLKKEISKSKNIPRRSFFLTLENQLYSIRSSFSEKGTEPC